MILRIIADAHGTHRHEPAGAMRDFYLLSGSDIREAPRILPWSLLIKYPRDEKHAGGANVLSPLGLNTYLTHSVPGDRRTKTKVEHLRDDELPQEGESIAVLVPAEMRKHHGKTELRFFRPRAFVVITEFANKRGVKTHVLKQAIKKFMSASGTWVILNGAPPVSLCSVCPDLWKANLGDCSFPHSRCFAEWRQYA